MSMTRREAAIKSCEDRIRHLESVPPHYYGKRQRGRAIELEKVKIKALRPVSREQVERVWPGCSFCKNDGVQDYRTAVCVTRWGMSYLKGPEIESDDIFYAQNHFCRFCGRPLTLEAWKEMRKRWEAANDAD